LRKKKLNKDDEDLENNSFDELGMGLGMGLFIYMANPWDAMILYDYFDDAVA
jgi:hypothetical protein